MENVHWISPELSFPIGVVFQVPDEFNGKNRGTYYFRSPHNHALRGPFISPLSAKLALHHDDDGA